MTPPYTRYAFWNPYNLSLLSGAASVSLLTGNWWLGLVGAGAEAIWMLFAPDSEFLRRAWFDPHHRAERERLNQAEQTRLISMLPNLQRQRVQTLLAKTQQIQQLSQNNQQMETALLQPELEKLKTLTDSYLQLMLSHWRYLEYAKTVDFAQLESDIRENERQAAKAPDEADRKLAQKNWAILLKRKQKLTEMKDLIRQTEGQMDLIENTFQLLGDQIVTMRSPRELSSQLDELIDGVEAVRSTARETDAVLAGTHE